MNKPAHGLTRDARADQLGRAERGTLVALYRSVVPERAKQGRASREFMVACILTVEYGQVA